MRHETRPSTWSMRTVLLVVLPFLAILLSLMVWVTALSRSGFWADDFLNVTHFARSLGDLSNDHINAGRYVANVFWAVGTYAFGLGSAVPFLMLDAAVFAAGLVIWLRGGTKTRWSASEAWWIGGLFIATATWLPTTLLSSAIGHSCGFLALGVGLLAHERCMRAATVRGCLLWSLASGMAWTLAVVSNLIYLGLLVIAAYCAFHQFVKLRGLGFSTIRGSVAVGFWNLLLPVVYFAAVAYPATTSKAEYADSGLSFFRQDFDFYRANLAPTRALQAMYLLVLVIGIVGAAVGVRRKDWFPIAVLGAAGATAVPAFVQGKQRGIEYLEMPLLLLFSAAVAGARPVLLGQSQRLVRLRGALLLAAIATLVLVFGQGGNVRSYFVQTPYGASLAAFRSEVAALTPEAATICARLNLDTQHQALLIAEMSGEDGFFVGPISAARAYLVPPGQRCPSPGPATNITVGLNARGDFVAAR